MTLNSLKVFLSKAEEQEKEYKWLEAARYYSEALASLSRQDHFETAGILERSGNAFFRAAMQADDNEEFRAHVGRAITEYEQARDIYREGLTSEERGRGLRCRAIIAFLLYWLASTASEKQKLVQEAWRLARDAFRAFSGTGSELEYGRTYNQLSATAFLTLSYDGNFQARQKNLRQAVDYGDKAIEYLSISEKPHELVTSYVKTISYLCWLVDYAKETGEKADLLRKARSYWSTAKGLSPEQADLSVESYPVYRVMTPADTLALVEKVLEHARRTKDRFAIGTALDFHTCLEWDENFFQTENPQERFEFVKRALRHSEEARHQYHVLGFTSPLGFYYSLWSQAPDAEYNRRLGQDVETDPKTRVLLLRKAVRAAPDMLNQARRSGYPEVKLTAHHVFSKSLSALAKAEPDRAEKRRLLRDALRHRKEAFGLAKHLTPFHHFEASLQLRHMAEIISELAITTKNSESKTRMLKTALSHQEASVSLAQKELPGWEKQGWHYYIGLLGQWQSESATLLAHIYSDTFEKDYLRRAASASQDAAEMLRKVNHTSRVAECYWRAAEAYDALKDHLKASENFLQASENYKIASEKIPPLKNYYLDYSTYMNAWSEIEKGRHHHTRREYGSAGQHYENAATLCERTTQWKCLASYHSSLAKLENGENLSIEDRNEEAIEAFEDAEKLFKESKTVLADRLASEERPDTRQTLTDLVHASQLNRDYCKARTVLEGATVLDKLGDHMTSAERYAQAATAFESLALGPRLEQERREIALMAILSRAWGTMTKGEGLGSPALLSRASRLFEKARMLSENERTSMLTLGHSHFCKALEAGASFVDRANLNLRLVATQHLDAAADCYRKAGLEKASEYAQAIRLLFDGYRYVNLARREADPEKKAGVYGLAHRILQNSADFFDRAGQQEKRGEVLRLLARVNTERDLAISLIDVLQIPPVAPITAALAAPRPTYEKPLGLERFEHADLEAKIRQRNRYLSLGQNFEPVIEITNTGRSSARLIKLEGAVPEGMDLVEGPKDYAVRGGRVELRGKRLEPLRTEELRLVMKPKTEGLFCFEPSVLYTDDTGNLRSHGLEPVDIVASPILQYLLARFIDDFTGEKLAYEHAGWRSLMDIVESLKIPRSQLYGDKRRGQSLSPRLQKLLRSGIVELRIFPEQRGRGGRTVKVRACYDREEVKRLVHTSSLGPSEQTEVQLVRTPIC